MTIIAFHFLTQFVVGGEDLAKIVGDLCLGKDQGNESFFPLGVESDASALADEMIYFEE